MKSFDDLELGKQIELPIDGMDFHPSGRTAGIALENFLTSWGDWINFIGQVLYMIQMELPYDKPVSTKFLTELFEYPEEPSIVIPKLIFDEGSWSPLHHDFVGLLMNSAITQLVTIYEVFIGELIESILWYDDQLMKSNEKQLSNAEIFELGDLHQIHWELIQRKVLKFTMSSYPNLVKRFQIAFHINIHGTGTAISLQEMHDFIEVRNVIVHSSGTASKQYYERMSVYEEKPLLENALESPEPNFSWLFDFSQRLAAHCIDLHAEVVEKWFKDPAELE